MIIPKEYKIGKERFIMEHNSLVSLNDCTEITYSDLKLDKDGKEYITIYFETPAGGDLGYAFCDATIDYPISNEQFRIINHYSEEQLKNLLYFYKNWLLSLFNLQKKN